MYDDSDAEDNTKRIEKKITSREVEVKFNHRNSKILRELLLTFKNLPLEKHKIKTNGFYKLFGKYFDSELLNMPVTEHNMEAIITLFPKISTAILILKDKYDTTQFLFQSLSRLVRLRTLKLHFVNRFAYGFSEPILKIFELKIYNYKPIINKFMIKHILNKVTKIKSLTISGGHFQRNVCNTIRNEKIFKLSIKNTKFDNGEIENFLEIISNYNLLYLKLIATNIHDQSHIEFSNFISNYLTLIPHENLITLSISLPQKDTKIDFEKIFQTLKKLTLFRVFFTRQKSLNSIEQLIPIIKHKTTKVNLEFIEYKNTMAGKNYTFNYTEFPEIESKKINFKKVTNPYLNKYKTPKLNIITKERLDAIPEQISSSTEQEIDSDSTIDMNVTNAHLATQTDSEEDIF